MAAISPIVSTDVQFATANFPSVDTEASLCSEVYDQTGSENVNGIDIIWEEGINQCVFNNLQDFLRTNNSSNYSAINSNKPPSPHSLKFKPSVYLGKDEQVLKELFDSCVPKINEVFVFVLATGTNILLNDTSYFIKAGSDFIKDLDTRKEIAIKEKASDKVSGELIKDIKGLPFTNNFNIKNQLFDFAANEAIYLINNSEFISSSISFLSGFLQVLNFQLVLLAPVYLWIAEKIEYSTNYWRANYKFVDSDWDPGAKIINKDGEEVENNNFSPKLLSGIKSGLENSTELINEIIEQLKSSLQQEFQSRLQFVHDPQIISKNNYPVLSEVFSFINKCGEVGSLFINSVVKGIEDMIPILAAADEKVINVVNAYYCGILNSLLEALLGIIDILGFIFKAVGKLGEKIADAEIFIHDAIKTYIETVKNILEINWSEIPSKAWEKIKEEMAKTNFGGLSSLFSLERAAYFVGGVIGFVIDLILEEFISGGVAGVDKTIKGFLELGNKIKAFVQLSVEDAFKKVVKDSFIYLMNLLNKFLEILAKGADAVADLISFLFQAFRRGFQALVEMKEEIKAIFGLIDSDVKLIEELGGEFTSLIGEICTICTKTD